jgi:hypothetical protein
VADCGASAAAAAAYTRLLARAGLAAGSASVALAFGLPHPVRAAFSLPSRFISTRGMRDCDSPTWHLFL